MARRFTVAHAAVALVTHALIAGTVPSGRPADAGMSNERLSRIHAAVQPHIDAGPLTGAVTLVARRGRIVHVEPEGRLASIVMVQVSVGAVQRDVGNAVAQAIVR